jgi:hypothetical protein
VANPRDEGRISSNGQTAYRASAIAPPENLWQAWTGDTVATDGDRGLEATSAPVGVTDPAQLWRAPACDERPGKIKEMWTQLAHTLDEIAPGGEPNPAIGNDHICCGSDLRRLRQSELSRITNSAGKTVDQLAAFARQFKDVHEFLSHWL